MSAPSRYLTLRTDSKGVRRYAAIYGGQPLCADQPTLARAWAALKPYWPDARIREFVDLWDGDLAEFREVSRPD